MRAWPCCSAHRLDPASGRSWRCLGVPRDGLVRGRAFGRLGLCAKEKLTGVPREWGLGAKGRRPPHRWRVRGVKLQSMAAPQRPVAAALPRGRRRASAGAGSSPARVLVRCRWRPGGRLRAHSRVVHRARRRLGRRGAPGCRRCAAEQVRVRLGPPGWTRAGALPVQGRALARASPGRPARWLPTGCCRWQARPRACGRRARHPAPRPPRVRRTRRRCRARWMRSARQVPACGEWG